VCGAPVSGPTNLNRFVHAAGLLSLQLIEEVSKLPTFVKRKPSQVVGGQRTSINQLLPLNENGQQSKCDDWSSHGFVAN
jgi:hypothetical protein